MTKTFYEVSYSVTVTVKRTIPALSQEEAEKNAWNPAFHRVTTNTADLSKPSFKLISCTEVDEKKLLSDEEWTRYL